MTSTCVRYASAVQSVLGAHVCMPAPYLRTQVCTPDWRVLSRPARRRRPYETVAVNRSAAVDAEINTVLAQLSSVLIEAAPQNTVRRWRPVANCRPAAGEAVFEVGAGTTRRHPGLGSELANPRWVSR